ncbi:hypothetical protein F4775DRAFT_560775 [Biscogniauxia sp. FL1348]|nr:hypothetical protein F4775DRAFT_560775 [Biscogniauxia sp. FL1348]
MRFRYRSLFSFPVGFLCLVGERHSSPHSFDFGFEEMDGIFPLPYARFQVDCFKVGWVDLIDMLPGQQIHGQCF